MAGIHSEILDALDAHFTQKMITDIAEDDPTRAGVVKQGHLQGDPSKARISVEIHLNDPDVILDGVPSGFSENWHDKVHEVEIPKTITYNRRFALKVRCLLANTQENLAEAQEISSTVRQRAEEAILSASMSGVASGNEYACTHVVAETMDGEVIQSGGPPDAYDFIFKVRFEIRTTNNS